MFFERHDDRPEVTNGICFMKIPDYRLDEWPWPVTDQNRDAYEQFRKCRSCDGMDTHRECYKSILDPEFGK